MSQPFADGRLPEDEVAAASAHQFPLERCQQTTGDGSVCGARFTGRIEWNRKWCAHGHGTPLGDEYSYLRGTS